jgi:TonB family protein
MDVTDVLRDRRHEPDGLASMAAVSVAVHAAIVAVVVFGPLHWSSKPIDEHKTTMTISLSGAGEGVQSTGLTAISARPVQTTEPAAVREAVRPPAATVPEMVVPKTNAKPAKPAKPTPAPAQPTPAPAQPTPDARGKTPTRGEEVRPGNAIADTGARGMGFGLSTGGGPGSGSSLDVADFCCPDYIAQMQGQIKSNWNQKVEVPGMAIIKFTIQRDGRLTDIVVERSSGTLSLDLNAQRSVMVTRQLTSLPSAFPNPTLTVHLNFQYQQ